MSIAILSIPVGIVAIILFIWSISKMGEKPAKGKKKDDDTALIGIIASVVLFFVALGIFDGKESTGGIFASDNIAQEQSDQRSSDRDSSKSDSQREVEEYNKAAVEKARSGESNENANSKNDDISKDNHNSGSSTVVNDPKEINETSKTNKDDRNKNLDKQQKAYQQWHNQIETKIQSIETTWAALWNDNSPDSIEKLSTVLENSKVQLEELKIPEELSAVHRQRLNESVQRYVQWIESHHKACQMKSSNNSQQDIMAEIARGDGLKLRSNVEISNIGRELGLMNQ